MNLKIILSKAFTICLVIAMGSGGSWGWNGDNSQDVAEHHANTMREQQLARFDKLLPYYTKHWEGIELTAVFYFIQSKDNSDRWVLEDLGAVKTRVANTYISLSFLEYLLENLIDNGAISEVYNSGSGDRLFEIIKPNLGNNETSETDEVKFLKMRFSVLTIGNYVRDSLAYHNVERTPRCEIPTHSYDLKVHQNPEQENLFGKINDITFHACLRYWEGLRVQKARIDVK